MFTKSHQFIQHSSLQFHRHLDSADFHYQFLESCRRHYFIEGRVKAFVIDPAGKEAVFSNQGPGEYFGGKGFDDWPQSACIKTVEPSRFLVLPQSEFREFLPRNYVFAARVFEKLAREVEEHARELSEALQQKTAISEILRSISSSPTDVRSVPEAVAENAARLCDVTDAEILQVEGDELRLVGKHGRSQQWPIGTARPINRRWVTGRAVVDRTSVHVLDLQEAEAEFPQGAAYAKQCGHRTTFATPFGIPDATNRQNVTFGFDGITRTVSHIRPSSAQMVCDGLIKTVTEHQAGSPQYDDMTVVVVRAV